MKINTIYKTNAQGSTILILSFIGALNSLPIDQLINGQTVQCTDEGEDKYGRTLSICFVNGVDLQSEMVRSGMAVAYLRYSRRYENEMVEAMTERVGMWSGNFLDPEDWRRENSVRD